MMQNIRTKDDMNGFGHNASMSSSAISKPMFSMSRNELLALCKEKGLKKYSSKKKSELVSMLSVVEPGSSETVADVTEDDADILPAAAARTHSAPIAIGEPFTFIDLFCGIGGFHQAMRSLGGTCVLACDIDAKCRAVYQKNYGLEPFPDVTKLVTSEMPDFDVLCGGFPCQAFSHAGKQNGFADTRGTLFRDVVRILRDKQPRYFLLENVKNLKGHDEGRTWATIYASLGQAGYVTYERPIVMSPHHFGVPQHRERVLLVGIRSDLQSRDMSVTPVFNPQPSDIHSILLDDDDVPAGLELKAEDIAVINKWDEFVSHFKTLDIKLPTFPIWTGEWDAGTLLKGLPEWKVRFIQQNRTFYDAHHTFLAEWLTAARLLPGFSGARAKFEWQCGSFLSSDTAADSLWSLLFQFRPSGIRVKRATYSPALVAMAQIVVVGSKKRKLCPREVARLQSFPDSFQLPDSASEAYRQFGNAVNVEVIRRAANIMFGL